MKTLSNKRTRLKLSLSDRIKPSKRIFLKRGDHLERSKTEPEGNPSRETEKVKLSRNDSFLKRLVKSSRENITEGCERLVRNIQKSPLLIRKKLSSKSSDSLGSVHSEERPVPPLRRKRSRKRPLGDQGLTKDSLRKSNWLKFQKANRKTEENNGVTPEEEVQPEVNHRINQISNRLEIPSGFSPGTNKRIFIDEESHTSSQSVSVEDVDDLIRSEDNFRLLEERALLRKRLEKFGRTDPPDDIKSKIEDKIQYENIRRIKSSEEPLPVSCHRRISNNDQEFLRSGSNNENCNTSKPRGQDSKSKSSPPPDDYLIQRSRLLLNCDNPNEVVDKEGQSTVRDSIVTSRHKTVTSENDIVELIKCRVANLTKSQESGDCRTDQFQVLLTTEPSSNDEQTSARDQDTSFNYRLDTDRFEEADSSGFVEDKVSNSYEDKTASNDTIDWDNNRLNSGSDSDDNSSSSLTDSSLGKVNREDSLIGVNSDKLLSINIVENRKGSSSSEDKKSFVRRGPIISRYKVPNRRASRESAMRMFGRMVRLRERLILCLSGFAILFTLLLVVDLQMDLGYSGHHLVPSHGRVKMGDEDRDTVYNSFRRKFLQRSNTSRESFDAGTQSTRLGNDNYVKTADTEKPQVHDDFADLMEFVINGDGVNVNDGVVRISGEDHSYNPTLGQIMHIQPR